MFLQVLCSTTLAEMFYMPKIGKNYKLKLAKDKMTSELAKDKMTSEQSLNYQKICEM